MLTETLNTSTEEMLRRELAEAKAKLEAIAEKRRERNRRTYWRNPEKANEKSRRYLGAILEDGKTRARHYYEKNRRGSFENRLKVMFTAARQRSKKNNIEFSITEADVARRESCPITGIILNFLSTKQCDESPTLDRIDPAKGYVPGNGWVVSGRANRIKSNATAEELFKIAAGLKKAADRLKMGLPACDAE